MKLITKIRKADMSKKTAIWQKADLSKNAIQDIVRQMVLTVPKGHYKLHSRDYGQNIVDTIYDMYGWMPSMHIDESIMLGAQCLYPDKVYASFTLGLDAIEIK